MQRNESVMFKNSKKNVVTGSTSAVRVQHLITTGAFKLSRDLPNHQVDLYTVVLQLQQCFEEKQKGALLVYVKNHITVHSLLKTPVPRRGSSTYPTFTNHQAFPIIPSTGTKHIILCDNRRGIFAYRVPLPMELVNMLEDSDKVGCCSIKVQ